MAVLIGIAVQQVLNRVNNTYPSAATSLSFNPPLPVPSHMFAQLTSKDGWIGITTVVPMALFNLFGDLANLESCLAVGDDHAVLPSILGDAASSLVGAFFGSPFCTTFYVGIPGLKNMGARAGYTAAHGLLVAILCVINGVTLVLVVLPPASVEGILVWIGIIITAQVRRPCNM